MSDQRIIIEMGTGNDQSGRDYTKAALRAVEDAIRHSSLTLFGALGLDHTAMRVQVTIGVQVPQAVDTGAIAASVPRGRVSVRVVRGGLDTDSGTVIATAAVEAFLPSQAGRWIAD